MINYKLLVYINVNLKKIIVRYIPVMELPKSQKLSLEKYHEEYGIAKIEIKHKSYNHKPRGGKIFEIRAKLTGLLHLRGLTTEPNEIKRIDEEIKSLKERKNIRERENRNRKKWE